ncbi:helix-turn-helix domain-containing protein [Burkholderia oklahomensis]|uniref:helix-turn-helix domain-containing protein n=1 Tax=Burkholderia oklahomensis TaxID=342113 RepID=UPI00016A9419|nr:helix-turn-helix transcriptional regulator [Burkholderia oklahomensis]AJX33195.1 helix-turn-helix family protein [Burkholderia oklahomensis C6786]MBI0359177.1 helix-turn-helix transcriptional regulator [Burkholderia oklahomensis]SUW58001.1 anaerobic benzoate catabolism transcriptional regulator [Burkholderia oklahomensis]
MAISPNTAAAVRARLAANLRDQRQQRGLSQEKLADEAGLHRTYVSQVERTIVNISLDNLTKLADALETDVHLLLKPRSAETEGGSVKPQKAMTPRKRGAR